MKASLLFSIKLFLLLLFLLFSTFNYASRYFICGPDENGCYDEIYQYCSCIPVNEIQQNKPFCFNDNLTCTPLAETPNCHPSSIYPTQNECLATIFHSLPEHPCTVTTDAFCLEHNSYFCAPDGNPSTCRKQVNNR